MCPALYLVKVVFLPFPVPPLVVGDFLPFVPRCDWSPGALAPCVARARPAPPDVGRLLYALLYALVDALVDALLYALVDALVYALVYALSAAATQGRQLRRKKAAATPGGHRLHQRPQTPEPPARKTLFLSIESTRLNTETKPRPNLRQPRRTRPDAQKTKDTRSLEEKYDPPTHKSTTNYSSFKTTGNAEIASS
eukprot:GHVT01020420.1.p1 GENE.GHVT01020420.1~~GHVT01020420.1.p1  ORF type:complete len:195 (+),score=32.35 GHVT01020420.1:733-1317(+)